jgi:hypothetical protein
MTNTNVPVVLGIVSPTWAGTVRFYPQVIPNVRFYPQDIPNVRFYPQAIPNVILFFNVNGLG